MIGICIAQCLSYTDNLISRVTSTPEVGPKQQGSKLPGDTPDMGLRGVIPEHDFGKLSGCVCIRYNVGDLFGARSGRSGIEGKCL
jgi:hypothetical protein